MAQPTADEVQRKTLTIEALRTHTIKKAERWRRDVGTTYDEAILKLVCNTFDDLLCELSNQYRPIDTSRIRPIVLDAIDSLDQDVQTHCTRIFERVTELWSLGVFHWDECREIVLGSLPISTPDMGKKSKGKKGKKKTQVKETNPNTLPVKPRHSCKARPARYEVYGDNRHGQPSKPPASKPSTISDRAAGDDGLTSNVTDLAPPKESDSVDSTLVGDDEPECYGVDIFLPASKRGKRDHTRLQQDLSTTSSPRRSLLDLYEANPDTRLSNIEEETLELAGRSAKQVVLEATHEFLEKCIPEADRERVWAQVLGRVREADGHGPKDMSIRVPDGTLDLKAGRRPLDLLMENCTHALASGFSTPDPRALKLVFNRAIVVCDALDDTKRRDALARALHAVDWLVVGLEVQTTAIYRSINEELDKIAMRYPASVTNKDRIVVSEDRRQAELDTLKRHKLTYDGFKGPFRAGFLQALQNLVRL